MMPPSGPPGPFETEREARELPAVRAVYAAFDADPGVGKMTPHIHRMLLDALAAAGVYLGAYDHRIAEWLASWEPQTVAVIAGWVRRAAEGPPGRETGDGPLPEGTASTARPPSRALAAGTRITRGADGGRAPHCRERECPYRGDNPDPAKHGSPCPTCAVVLARRLGGDPP